MVFINGYQQDCSTATFAGTFGTADQLLAANGEVSLFFNNCSYGNRPNLETLGQGVRPVFWRRSSTRTETAVDTVDVVVHSMGGLILRSYLAGKDPSSGAFAPPATVPVRKVIFLATPHYGTGIAFSATFFGTNAQTDELSSGSRFLWDLNTWNQGTDDLRGVDALAVIGNGGNGAQVLGIGNGQPKFDDGVVTLTSGSLRFYKSDRTRILPVCHTDWSLIALLCPSMTSIANLSSATADVSKIVLSFLNDTADWQNIGASASADSYLAASTGLLVAVKTADDKLATLDSVSAGSKKLTTAGNKEVAYTDLITAGALAFNAGAGGASIQKTVNVGAGAYAPVLLKTGPRMTGVLPAAAAVFPYAVAAGEIVAIYGEGLAKAQVTVNGTPATIIAAVDSQINAILPTTISGLVQVTAKDSVGSHTLNVLVEPSVPAIFSADFTGKGPAAALNAITYQPVTAGNPLRPGDWVSLYLTGLGTAAVQPTVKVGGLTCPWNYAGGAPGYPGLDQINCQIPSGTPAGNAAVTVTIGKRTSNTVTLAIAQ